MPVKPPGLIAIILGFLLFCSVGWQVASVWSQPGRVTLPTIAGKPVGCSAPLRRVGPRQRKFWPQGAATATANRCQLPPLPRLRPNRRPRRRCRLLPWPSRPRRHRIAPPALSTFRAALRRPPSPSSMKQPCAISPARAIPNAYNTRSPACARSIRLVPPTTRCKARKSRIRSSILSGSSTPKASSRRRAPPSTHARPRSRAGLLQRTCSTGSPWRRHANVW